MIGVDYAKALLNTKKATECIKILSSTLILPQEGAREGHEIFMMANIAAALNKIDQKKYQEAIAFLKDSKQFPENLGSGMPYDPDYRLQDYLLAYCESKSGDEKKAV